MNLDRWLAVIGIVISGSFGMLALVYERMKRKREELNRQQRFEWPHIHSGIRQIAAWLRRRKFQPDIIIAIPGGGTALADLLAMEFGEFVPVLPVQQFQNKHAPMPDPNYKTCATAKWTFRLPLKVISDTNQKVVIIDDFASSGDSLRQIKTLFTESGVPSKNVLTVSLVAVAVLKETGKAPDYAWFWVDSYEVHMPWGHASKVIRAGLQ